MSYGLLIDPEKKSVRRISAVEVVANLNEWLGSCTIYTVRLVIEGIPCLVYYDDEAHLKHRPVSVYGSGVPPIRGPIVILYYDYQAADYRSLTPAQQSVIESAVEDGTVLASPYIRGYNC